MKKILYLVGQNFSHYFLAKSIQDKIDVESYAIFDVTNKPRNFFENQKIVNFKKIWFFHDFINDVNSMPDLDFLADFEKKYQIQLSKLVFSERVFTDFNEFYKFSTEEILKILELESRNFCSILEEIKPDFIIMTTPYFQYQVLFLKLCKSMGIKVLEINAGRFSSEANIGFSDELKNYQEFLPSEPIRTFDELRKFRNEKNIFKQNKPAIEKIVGDKNSILSAGLNYFLFSKNDNTKTHYTYFGRNKLKVFLNYLTNEIKVKQRKKFLDQNFNLEIPDGKYILFPLQTEAESSLLVDAPLFTNQIEIIKQISKSIPVDYKLIVKEHPGQITRSWRSIDTYKRILDIPKVIPIHPSVNIEKVIEKASLIITISSSVALDALFYEKPSMMLAENSFSVIPSIFKIKNIENLSNDINKILNEKINAIDIEKYIQFSEEKSFNFDLINFGNDINEYFYHSGKFVDVNISEAQIKLFLENENERLTTLSNAYIDKMNNYD